MPPEIQQDSDLAFFKSLTPEERDDLLGLSPKAFQKVLPSFNMPMSQEERLSGAGALLDGGDTIEDPQRPQIGLEPASMGEELIGIVPGMKGADLVGGLIGKKVGKIPFLSRLPKPLMQALGFSVGEEGFKANLDLLQTLDDGAERQPRSPGELALGFVGNAAFPSTGTTLEMPHARRVEVAEAQRVIPQLSQTLTGQKGTSTMARASRQRQAKVEEAGKPFYAGATWGNFDKETATFKLPTSRPPDLNIQRENVEEFLKNAVPEKEIIIKNLDQAAINQNVPLTTWENIKQDKIIKEVEDDIAAMMASPGITPKEAALTDQAMEAVKQDFVGPVNLYRLEQTISNLGTRIRQLKGFDKAPEGFQMQASPDDLFQANVYIRLREGLSDVRDKEALRIFDAAGNDPLLKGYTSDLIDRYNKLIHAAVNIKDGAASWYGDAMQKIKDARFAEQTGGSGATAPVSMGGGVIQGTTAGITQNIANALQAMGARSPREIMELATAGSIQDIPEQVVKLGVPPDPTRAAQFGQLLQKPGFTGGAKAAFELGTNQELMQGIGSAADMGMANLGSAISGMTPQPAEASPLNLSAADMEYANQFGLNITAPEQPALVDRTLKDARANLDPLFQKIQMDPMFQDFMKREAAGMSESELRAFLLSAPKDQAAEMWGKLSMYFPDEFAAGPPGYKSVFDGVVANPTDQAKFRDYISLRLRSGDMKSTDAFREMQNLNTSKPVKMPAVQSNTVLR